MVVRRATSASPNFSDFLTRILRASFRAPLANVPFIVSPDLRTIQLTNLIWANDLLQLECLTQGSRLCSERRSAGNPGLRSKQRCPYPKPILASFQETPRRQYRPPAKSLTWIFPASGM